MTDRKKFFLSVATFLLVLATVNVAIALRYGSVIESWFWQQDAFVEFSPSANSNYSKKVEISETGSLFVKFVARWPDEVESGDYRGYRYCVAVPPECELEGAPNSTYEVVDPSGPVSCAFGNSPYKSVVWHSENPDQRRFLMQFVNCPIGETEVRNRFWIRAVE